jgi:AraC family transcriptional regulator
MEENLLEEINLDSIAKNVNVSKFHLLRIWKGATSTGLMEYVRRRRIAVSLTDLLNDRYSIDFLSSKYSFGSERTYKRVFKEEFDMTPAKWRRNPTPLHILDRFNAEFMNLAGEGIIFFHSIVILPAFRLAGMEYRVGIEDNYRNQTATRYGVDFFHMHRKEIQYPVEKDNYYGLTTVPGKHQSYTLYQPSVKVDSRSIVPPYMKVRHIRPHKYGVFKYIGAHSAEEISSKTLESIWRYVFDLWMPTMEFRLDETFHFEFVNFTNCNKHYCECELYYPISTLK